MAAPITSLSDQADIVHTLVERFYMMDGVPSDEAFLHIDAPTAEALRLIATRLQRMAPHEDAIRKLVTGR